ncbi:MAG: DNA methyltransferase [Coriobacteriales bacterium]|nr:DNA methyltransferase [Coriobacteriales bacterium]
MLSADGAIFISIDDGEAANLQKVCEEVFGAQCFVGNISWQRTYSPRNDSKGLPAEVEHLLVFSKTPSWIPKRLPRTAEMDSRYSSPDGDPRPWTSSEAAAPGAVTHQGMVYAIQHPLTGELLYPPNGRCRPFGGYSMLDLMSGWAEYEWRDIQDEVRRAEICGISPEEVRPGVKALMLKEATEETYAKARERYSAGCWPKLYFTNNGLGGMRCKRYVDEVEGLMPTNLWTYESVGHTDEAKKALKKLFDGTAPFDTPKPVRLMDRILTIASDSDSLVLDFFSGSASMGEAVLRKNSEDGGTRRFVLVQIPEAASGDFNTLCDVGEERLRRVRKSMLPEGDQLDLDDGPHPDLGFRVLRVDDSVLKDTYADPSSTTQASLFDLVDNLEDGATGLDLLFQVLPKFRIPYSASIEQRTICGCEVFDVNDGQLLACFDRSVSTDAIEAIAKEQPLYAVFRDASFTNDAAVANLEELFKTFSPDTIRRVI